MCRHSQPKERHNLFGHDFRFEIRVVNLELRAGDRIDERGRILREGVTQFLHARDFPVFSGNAADALLEDFGTAVQACKQDLAFGGFDHVPVAFDGWAGDARAPEREDQVHIGFGGAFKIFDAQVTPAINRVLYPNSSARIAR